MNSMVSSILFPDSAFDKLLTIFWHTDLTWHCKHTLCFQTCGLSPIRLAYNGSYGLQEIDAWTHSHIDLECIFFVGRAVLKPRATWRPFLHDTHIYIYIPTPSSTYLSYSCNHLTRPTHTFIQKGRHKMFVLSACRKEQELRYQIDLKMNNLKILFP